MNRGQRRGGYLATAEGVKKLKEARQVKQYTYDKIFEQTKNHNRNVTLEQVQRLFHPEWGNGKYKVEEEAVEAICRVLNLQPEDIVAYWDADKEKRKRSDSEVLSKIEQAARDGREELDLSGMKLTELPPNISKLTKLKKLILGKFDKEKWEWIGNSLRSLPPEIGQLINLTELDLSSNDVGSLPSEIGQLTNLTVLNLKSNSLSSLPSEIGQLIKLTELYLYDNSLENLPLEIIKLINIEFLDLDNNSLSNLPPEIGQLQNLKNLELGGNSLSNLPPEIGQLKNLERLGLGGNSLSNLPPEIGQLKNLKQLDLNNNSLSSLPSEIRQLTNLTGLYINSSFLSNIPPEIVQLINLKRLDINNSSLSNIPSEIEQLTKLTELYLEYNFLSSLPPEIGQLKNLKKLDLRHNSLSSLPPEIGQLKNLTELDLGYNSLSSLPPEIGQLKNLKKLDLGENNLSIPLEILEKRHKPAAIINYYLSLQSNHKKPLHEAKMLLVGQSSAGKTCLRERLIKNQYNPCRNKTNGIDIESWKIQVEDKELQVNIWDFGGQEIMHSTHQFFLTKRSLYILVVDTTQSEEENRIEYWLKIIKSFGKDSPVIIVGNKADQHPLDIDKRGLQTKYPQIKAFVETSCQKGTGIKNLEDVIKEEITQLEHIDDELPLNWFNIKKQLEALNKDYIPYEQYESLCEEEGVSEEDNQRILIQFLHDLGIVVNFQDDRRLEDTNVLNPEWLTNGVYKILNDYQLIVGHNGILNIEMLTRILEHDRYPTKKHLFIIDMMRKFELCFDVESDKKFLIPDILPKEERFIGEWDNTLAFEYHYPVLPSSIISRFIVRMNHYIHKNTYWRSGVVLANESNIALVKADREDKKIFIRINGKESTRRNLLTAIRSQFDYIHRSITGIVPEEKVPLIDHPEIILDYQELLCLEEMGETSVIIGKLKQRIPLKQLLDGIESQQNRRQKDEIGKLYHYPDQPKNLPQQKERNKEIFISYSWSEESQKIADQLDAAFQAKGIMIMRDLREVGYKDRIKAFMENLGRGKCVIVIISKAYLESENCMFELLQIAKHGEFYERVFPIVLDDAKIYKSKDRIKYVQYWEKEIKELNEAMNTVGNANLQGFREDIDLYTEIRNIFSPLINILKDMNALTAKIHSESDFKELIEAVESKLTE